MTVKIEGIDQVLKNIDAELRKVEGRTMAGLDALGNVVLSRSNKRVPHEHSNLFGSGYARRAQGDRNAVEVGYEAAYALPLHENVEMQWRGKPRRSGKGVYWGPRGEAKFLEKALRESRKDAASIVARFVRRGR